MSSIAQNAPGKTVLLMGNEAIARGALEAGVKVCAAYPGNPSSEIVGALARVAKEMGLHVEWSVNEKVALEVAAAASFAGLRGLCAMKQNGLNVACDFLLSLNLTGCDGGLVVVVADDPSGISSSNEEDSRIFAKLGDLPLLEPATFQEAKEMTKTAFEMSEELKLPVLIRTVTRVSHARGNVSLEELPQGSPRPRFDLSRPRCAFPTMPNHKILHERLNRAKQIVEELPFNLYRGPEKPEWLIVTSGSGYLYSLEAIANLRLQERVGIVKIGTTWPLPENFLLKHLQKTDQILFVEEVDPFLENNVKVTYAQNCAALGIKSFFGKVSKDIPEIGELNPEIVTHAIQRLLGTSYEPRPAEYARAVHEATSELVPVRALGFCPGCPHRATYWALKVALALDGREGFVLGDIGCYGLGMGPSGFGQMKTLHAMGSGAGLACGFGQLAQFGLEQPVVAVCGDSTFYHAAMPALVNARYNGANFLLLLLDNSATAMTGFQPHPGTGSTATGEIAPVIDLRAVCESFGAHVEIGDPFDVPTTVQTILKLLEDDQGVKVLILKRECALVSARKERRLYRVKVDQDRCLGESCGCNRLCTRVYKCPGLMWDSATKKARIDEAICTGCGVCAEICPASAIRKEAA
ncbi:MAG: thiamine pyrophosphate-dependent enzyme [Thermodesulfobacteriota bacterium]